MNNPTARRAIGYTRLSKDELTDKSVSPAAQEKAIREAAKHEGLELADVFHEPPGSTGRNSRRVYLQAALAKLETGAADALICARLDRLGRSVSDISGLLDRAQDQGWALILLDVGIDTRTPEGEVFALNLANFAQFERKRISDRTRSALRQKRAEGVKLGRPRATKPTTITRIKNLRGPADNPKRTPYRIAKELNGRGVRTDTGADWTPAAVKRVLRYGDEAAA